MRSLSPPSLALLALFTACVPKSSEGDDDDTGTSEIGTTEIGTTEPTTQADSTGDSADETAGSGGDSDSDTAGEPPPECDPPGEAGAAAGFSLDLPGWPHVNPSAYDYAVVCNVDAVTDGETALTCDVDGALLPATLWISDAPEGDATWAAGMTVLLIAESEDLEDTDNDAMHFVLRDMADDSMLAVGVSADYLTSGWFSPISVHQQLACGAVDNGIDGGPTELELEFSVGDADTIVLSANHRGSLPAGGGQMFAIDVDRAVTNLCCHSTVSLFNVLARRVAP